MKTIIVNTAKITGGLLLILALIALLRFGLAHRHVATTPLPTTRLPLDSTASLTILPLYEEAAANDTYIGGHGVSYLLRTPETTILMDLGNNPDRHQPAPLLANMAHAGIPPAADLLFISHAHPDHTGGLQGTGFTTPDGQPLLDLRAVYTPQPMDVAGRPGTVATEPQVLAPGVATLGLIPYVQPFPFSLWQPLAYEQVLAVNVAGHGIILITGCGHPTVERIVERAEALFAQPVVGIAGGLHYGTRTAPDLAAPIHFLQARDLHLLALSPHDSEAPARAAFATAFPAATHPIQIGTPLHLGAPR